ncbi:MAG: GIY-YIG nuclease family protein [Nitrospirae bacterium]|nr:GIY-YIG nuclease family protein [Nitrospirota bacterium]
MNRKIKRKSSFHVYIVTCKNGTYYTGYTNNLENRIKLHNKGDGAKYLKGKSPVTLVYSKEYVYFKNALNAERKIKMLTRKNKEALTEAYKKNILKHPKLIP